MKRFAVFNPEHDLALANGDAHYLAPRNIREMAHDLAPLMDYLAWDTPWGWDAAVVNYLHKSGIPRQELPTDAMLAALRTRSERITAHHLLQQILPLSGHLTGESYVCRSLDDIKAYATQHSHLLLKAPLSGSGKGLRHLNFNDDDNKNDNENYPTSRKSTSALTSTLKKVESWCDALIRRHGYLTAEPYYDKVQDFAMEFIVADGQCHFIGYSLFTTDDHGRYDSNLLLSDADIEARLSNYIPRSVLHDVRHFVEAHTDLIVPAEWDTSRFPITFGIDMMIVNLTGQQPTADGQQSTHPDGNSQLRTHNSQFKLHPCVEINLRMNMGIIAHEVRRHLMAPEATGIYRLALFADHAALAAFDEEQRALYPALYRDGLLVRGYHPLTSTEGNARHLAYIIGGITQL
ncbi:MAG: hypothetical protein IJA98_04830 [Bacteroidaceae bacterium]|nr:hypothetical protein [Bacteroidaceae bacterium]